MGGFVGGCATVVSVCLCADYWLLCYDTHGGMGRRECCVKPRSFATFSFLPRVDACMLLVQVPLLQFERPPSGQQDGGLLLKAPPPAIYQLHAQPHAHQESSAQGSQKHSSLDMSEGQFLHGGQLVGSCAQCGALQPALGVGRVGTAALPGMQSTALGVQGVAAGLSRRRKQQVSAEWRRM